MDRASPSAAGGTGAAGIYSSNGLWVACLDAMYHCLGFVTVVVWTFEARAY